MPTVRVPSFRRAVVLFVPLLLAALIFLSAPATLLAQPAAAGGEAHLFARPQPGHLHRRYQRPELLMCGLGVCALGLLFGSYLHALRNLPCARIHARNLGADLRDLQNVPRSRKASSWRCWRFSSARSSSFTSASWTYGGDQSRLYPAFQPVGSPELRRGLVRHPREHVRQLAYRLRQPHAAKPVPATHSPEGRDEHRHDADQHRAGDHALILLFMPGDYAGPCFIGFAIGESLGAAALRVAGGIFTKIADIGADLMKIVFKIKEDDASNPGVIADLPATMRAIWLDRAWTASKPTVSPASR